MQMNMNATAQTFFKGPTVGTIPKRKKRKRKPPPTPYPLPHGYTNRGHLRGGDPQEPRDSEPGTAIKLLASCFLTACLLSSCNFIHGINNEGNAVKPGHAVPSVTPAK